MQADADPAVEELKAGFRQLWMEHAFWMRNYIVSASAGLDDQSVVLARLLDHQQDIGDAIKRYYGETAGNKLADLLREHVLVAGKYLDAVQRGHREDAYKYKDDWYRNAEDIAVFLSQTNSRWSFETLNGLLNRHMDLVTADFNARLNKDWPADINAFDQGKDHLLKLADVLASGIVQQFPQKFGMPGTGGK
ncbi:glycosyltransferase [Paenibacillus oralis]|uniref:Glycosyltransferase n=1 Tax=Paenibacillus oralis TaxID=2490856 RepID=A0A3P3UCT0_9BACL|nr:glycosyltransferase [Paenibacillus oralis]